MTPPDADATRLQEIRERLVDIARWFERESKCADSEWGSDPDDDSVGASYRGSAGWLREAAAKLDSLTSQLEQAQRERDEARRDIRKYQKHYVGVCACRFGVNDEPVKRCMAHKMLHERAEAAERDLAEEKEKRLLAEQGEDAADAEVARLRAELDVWRTIHGVTDS